MRKAVWALVAGGALWAFPVAIGHAQAPSAAPPDGRQRSTLGQLMKGTFYPAANVFFAAQDVNPAEVPRAKDPNMATDLLASSYGKWEAVENSALAISDLADLLALPGRKCANGQEVPVNNADWVRFVQELRNAGMTAYAAAQSRNQDKITDAADVMAMACSHCHLKYREKRNPADRCK